MPVQSNSICLWWDHIIIVYITKYPGIPHSYPVFHKLYSILLTDTEYTHTRKHKTKLVVELDFFNLCSHLGGERGGPTKSLFGGQVKSPQVSFPYKQAEKYFVVSDIKSKISKSFLHKIAEPSKTWPGYSSPTTEYSQAMVLQLQFKLNWCHSCTSR